MIAPRILDYNYPFDPTVSVTGTSEDVNFPASNLQKTIRSKTWRSTGNFVIDSTNGSVDFKETAGGAQKTATVAPGTYTPASLATAIAAALTAAGTVAYTATYSATTGKWTLSTAGAYLSLLWSSGTHAASSIGSTLGYATGADGTGATSYTGARIAIHTEEAVVIDCKTAAPIDSLLLIFDAMIAPKLSSSAQIWVQASATNSWAAPAINQAVTLNTTYSVASFYWATLQTYRYWRIRIVDPQNTYLYVELGKVILSGSTQMTRLPANGFQWTLTDQTQVDRTPYGHEYADLYPVKKDLSIQLSSMPYADMKAWAAIYRRLGLSTPFVFVLDPLAAIYDKDQFHVYGKFSKPFDTAQTVQAYFDEQITISEVF